MQEVASVGVVAADDRITWATSTSSKCGARSVQPIFHRFRCWRAEKDFKQSRGGQCRSRAIALGTNRFTRRDGKGRFRAAVQPRTQLIECRSLRRLTKLVQQIVGQRHAGQGCARFEPAV